MRGKHLSKRIKNILHAEEVKVFVDCSIPAKDDIIDPVGVEKYLIDNIKYEGKTGNFERRIKGTDEVVKTVEVRREGDTVHVNARRPFNKRYLKKLMRGYLVKQQVKDYLRIISSSKASYRLQYYRQKRLTC